MTPADADGGRVRRRPRDGRTPAAFEPQDPFLELVQEPLVELQAQLLVEIVDELERDVVEVPLSVDERRHVPPDEGTKQEP